MPSRSSGRGLAGASPQVPGAPRLLLAHRPVLLWFAGWDCSLNLSALGSGPDALPRGLGHSVPAPPRCQLAGVPGAALADRLPGPRAAPPTRHPGSARARASPPPIWGPGWARGSHTPLDTGLEAWLPPLRHHPPCRHRLVGLARPLPCWPHQGPQRPPRPGCPGWEARHGDCRHACGGCVPRAVERWAEGLHQGSPGPPSLSRGTGVPNTKRHCRVTPAALSVCASQAPTPQSQAPKDHSTRWAAQNLGGEGLRVSLLPPAHS